MSMNLRWVGREAADQIADVRMRCFGAKPSQRADFLQRTQNDRFSDGDVILADEAGETIGSATHLSLSMGIAGRMFPCQGVAWVGTAKSHRRRKNAGRGVASAIMAAIVNKARDQGDVLTALMPFRASFYEHFGYGVVERMNVWTLPLALLEASSDGFRQATQAHWPAMAACRTRQVQAGQCDVDTGIDGVQFWAQVDETIGFTFVDQPDLNGLVGGFMTVGEVIEGDQAIAVVTEPAYDSPASLMRLLGFLGSLRDQYSAVRLHLPTDVPINWLLKERQIPHRRVDHPAPLCQTISRMQLRVLDHCQLLDGIKLQTPISGSLVVSVQECEGSASRFKLSFADGQIEAKPSAESPAIELPDQLWASIVCGTVSARWANQYGLIRADERHLAVLEAFTQSPAGFCWEYF